MFQNYFGRVLTILVVLFVALFGFPGCESAKGVFNLGKLFGRGGSVTNLKPGIDIAGGTKLLYEIKPPPGGFHSSSGLSLPEEVAAALKRRVDPNGVRNLVWRPQGDSRLEIQLPRSAESDRSDAVKRDWNEAQRELEQTNVKPTVVIRAIEHLTGEARAKRLKVLAGFSSDADKGGSAERLKTFTQLADLWDQAQAAKAKHDDNAQATAELAYEELKKNLDSSNLTTAQLQSILEIPTASARQKKLDELKKSNAGFPNRLAAIDHFAKAHGEFIKLKGAIDDASELKKLLRGSGVLEFHILVDNPRLDAPDMVRRLLPDGPGPEPKTGDTMEWFLVENNRLAEFHNYTQEFNGKHYTLAYITPDKSMVHRSGEEWALEDASPDRDQSTGRQHVRFAFDPQGAKYFSILTGNNINRNLAIVLDNKIISAPVIRSQIGAVGQIDGGERGYTQSELNYLVNTLKAGSLPATLADEPISEQTISPSFGEDNLRSGLLASAIGLVAVATFMIGYYYLAGLVATFAVVMNLFIILGVLAMFGATFTMPSIAGIVLTVGTAIDANVLTFERLREEQHRGMSLKMAVRNAYDRAASAIIDSNMTTAITSIILYLIGTEEVKGFGLTLLIGICSSLFTALFVTKTVFGLLIDKVGIKHLGSLPASFPKWDALLKPNINWMRLVWPFVIFSTVLILAGMSAFVVKQREMYDIEFASGTSVQFELKEPSDIATIRNLLAPAEKKGLLPSPGVNAIGTTNRVWEVVTPNDKAAEVKQAILDTFKDKLKTDVPSTFDMADKTVDEAMTGTVVTTATRTASGPTTAPEAVAANVSAVIPVTRDSLTVDGVDVPDAESHFRGVAVVLRHLNPGISPTEIRRRIEKAALLTGGQHTWVSNISVDRLDGETGAGAADKPAVNVVVLASDPDFPYSFEKQKDWKEHLAGPLWSLIKDGVNKEAKLDKVNNFDPQVAGDTRLDAALAATLSIIIIMIYIWLRFGNMKYGTATMVALVHDTLATVGMIGMSHWLANTWIGDALLLESFRVNLTLVAGVLTIMGYSMIDTIVVFDRIRENRGRYGHISKKVINDSINQTLSRTLLTLGTTSFMVLVMYICGGPGIHGFMFVLLGGIIVGTYSSVAIAAPLLLLGKETRLAEQAERQQAAAAAAKALAAAKTAAK